MLPMSDVCGENTHFLSLQMILNGRIESASCVRIRDYVCTHDSLGASILWCKKKHSSLVHSFNAPEFPRHIRSDLYFKLAQLTAIRATSHSSAFRYNEICFGFILKMHTFATMLQSAYRFTCIVHLKWNWICWRKNVEDSDAKMQMSSFIGRAASRPACRLHVVVVWRMWQGIENGSRILL